MAQASSRGCGRSWSQPWAGQSSPASPFSPNSTASPTVAGTAVHWGTVAGMAPAWVGTVGNGVLTLTRFCDQSWKKRIKIQTKKKPTVVDIRYEFLPCNLFCCFVDYTLPVQKKKLHTLIFCWTAFCFDYRAHFLWHCFGTFISIQSCIHFWLRF